MSLCLVECWVTVGFSDRRARKHVLRIKASGECLAVVSSGCALTCALLRARRVVQLRMRAEGRIDDSELKASMETFRTREAAIAAELASIGEHSPLAGIAGRPGAARIWGGPTLGLKRHVIRACRQVPPVGFIVGTTAETHDPGLITVNLRR